MAEFLSYITARIDRQKGTENPLLCKTQFTQPTLPKFTPLCYMYNVTSFPGSGTISGAHMLCANHPLREIHCQETPACICNSGHICYISNS